MLDSIIIFILANHFLIISRCSDFLPSFLCLHLSSPTSTLQLPSIQSTSLLWFSVCILKPLQFFMAQLKVVPLLSSFNHNFRSSQKFSLFLLLATYLTSRYNQIFQVAVFFTQRLQLWNLIFLFCQHILNHLFWWASAWYLYLWNS